MPNPPGRRASDVTIREVAAAAGVSITAVSHALNGKGTLSPATRDRIRDVADELGYAADGVARRMRRSSMHTIGLVLRALDSPTAGTAPPHQDVFQRFVGLAAAEAANRGLCLTLVPDLGREPVPRIAYSLDGYLVTDPRPGDPVLDELIERRLPYVTYGPDPSRPDFPFWVAATGSEPAALALDHLTDAGATTVAIAAGTGPSAARRAQEGAYLRWCARHRAVPRCYELPDGEPDERGQAVAARIVADGPVDAVFCLTARDALAVQNGLVTAGVRVPEQTMIVAGADSELCRRATPAISAVDDPAVRCVAALLDMLQARITGEEPPGPFLAETRLAQRASTS